jgi:hypothetical protein
MRLVAEIKLQLTRIAMQIGQLSFVLGRGWMIREGKNRLLKNNHPASFNENFVLAVAIQSS